MVARRSVARVERQVDTPQYAGGCERYVTPELWTQCRKVGGLVGPQLSVRRIGLLTAPMNVFRAAAALCVRLHAGIAAASSLQCYHLSQVVSAKTALFILHHCFRSAALPTSRARSTPSVHIVLGLSFFASCPEFTSSAPIFPSSALPLPSAQQTFACLNSPLSLSH